MNTLAETILITAQSLPEGGTVSPKEYLHLATRAAVDQTFTRLAREGKLLRVGRGIYAAPLSSRFGPHPPSTEKLIESIAEKLGEVIVPHGAAAANALGLTTQVPITEVFLTSGRNRTLKLGKRIIQVKHAPRWQLALSGHAGMAIRATWWMGPEFAKKTVKSVRRKLSREEWAQVVTSRTILPAWMAKAIGEEMTRD